MEDETETPAAYSARPACVVRDQSAIGQPYRAAVGGVQPLVNEERASPFCRDSLVSATLAASNSRRFTRSSIFPRWPTSFSVRLVTLRTVWCHVMLMPWFDGLGRLAANFRPSQMLLPRLGGHGSICNLALSTEPSQHNSG